MNSAAYQKTWREKNREAFNKYAREYAQRNREKINKAQSDRRLFKKYGITRDQYDQILVGQGGHCALCSRGPTDTARLAVDHCHETGVVRGLLCPPCNRALGVLGDSKEHLNNVVKYLNNAYTKPTNNI